VARKAWPGTSEGRPNANTTNAGSGSEILAGIDAVQNNPTLAAVADFENIGATGHSQGGGGGATNAGRDPRVDTVFPLEPAPTFATGNLTIPAIFFAGQSNAVLQALNPADGASPDPAAPAPAPDPAPADPQIDTQQATAAIAVVAEPDYTG
jgi:hypothetical protein